MFPLVERLSHRISYHLEMLLTRGPLYQLMLVAVLILMLSLGGGIFVHVTNPDAYSNTLEAIWWAFLRLTDPGYLGDDRGFFPRLTSTFLTLAGYVVFLGALVALMTNWLDRTLEHLASGRSQIFEQGHLLIIGWNERLHALVEEIVHTRVHYSNLEDKSAIVILCEDYQPSMYRELIQKLDPDVRGRCRLLIRSGNPLEVESLERVDFAYARSIILIAGEGTSRSDRSLSDITLAKVLMSMKAHAPEPKIVPNVVVEVANSGNKLLVESVGWPNHTEAVVADDIMGRLFCQAIRFPGISRVYHRLLTDTFGHTIVLRKASDLGLVGKSLRKSIHTLRLGTPIGLLSAHSASPQVKLLDLDSKLAADDRVVVVCSSEPRDAFTGRLESELQIPVEADQKTTHRLLAVGWSTDLSTLLMELSANKNEECIVTLLWEAPHPAEQERLELWETERDNLTLKFVQAPLLDQKDLVRANIDQFNKILLLADQTQTPLVADAENVLRYVLLDRHIQREKLAIDLVIELNDEDNRPLLAASQLDVLMTSEILSHLLAQVSSHRSLMGIYEELFTKGGAELRLRPVSSISQEPVSFALCQHTCMKVDAVALGYCREEKVVFNPSPDTLLQDGDRIILVEHEER